MTRRLTSFAHRLRRDRSGVALLEFAFSLPLLLLLSLTGAELTNYIITRMRISQIALHLADNAARIGSGSQLQAKQITEADINDLLTGAGLQSGELALFTNGRVIISSVEPSTVNTANSRIRWQRCRGAKTSHASTYGTVANSTNVTGIGPTGRQVAAPASGVTMFVEVYYEYQPLVKTSLAPTTDMTEIASMMVRDRRDTTGGTNGVYQVTGVTASGC
ncbi:pilus assembly protein [Sphingomonas sp. MG17]|uniref:Pilus assembly protein n=1 Tax=Sphingomonas tagetis TaxID=2949092 RepID=A0A9X2HNQ9_9SPHN|nr:pilus assembly protein [Sphingomonas tagetis]MCP3731781.1 pilus assembly protein [Sphingomonas tagetis]